MKRLLVALGILMVLMTLANAEVIADSVVVSAQTVTEGDYITITAIIKNTAMAGSSPQNTFVEVCVLPKEWRGSIFPYTAYSYTAVPITSCCAANLFCKSFNVLIDPESQEILYGTVRVPSAETLNECVPAGQTRGSAQSPSHTYSVIAGVYSYCGGGYTNFKYGPDIYAYTPGTTITTQTTQTTQTTGTTNPQCNNDCTVLNQCVGDRRCLNLLDAATNRYCNKLVADASCGTTVTTIPPCVYNTCTGNFRCLNNALVYDPTCTQPVCGDGVCGQTESQTTCPADCKGGVDYSLLAVVGIVVIAAGMLLFSKKKPKEGESVSKTKPRPQYA